MTSRAAVLARPVALALLAAGVATASVTGAAPPSPAVTVEARAVVPSAALRVRPAVVERRVIGESHRGRAIRAWRLGDPDARVTAVALAAMHGDEAAPRAILTALRDGRPIRGVDLWVVPVLNPDGVARHSRRNARGVDLNRNFPYDWKPLDGAVESGPRPASEPETRALMRFVRSIDPTFVVTFHQPLNGVDVGSAKMRWFARRLSDELRLPPKDFDCGSTCHGTFTQWMNHRLDGVNVTVEYPRSPSRERLEVRAPRQLLRALGGRFA